ncbi:probable cytochrome P450 12a5, mitochondrial [Phymastichus coffea]|uniref:probable cytochrome P450 12a5, mitochondrial n=1 Tax=Phymastichus coffea TaxID=108790 RepID=UPI00273CE47F|nr:probable cytochrome P450 12a5, mitochondrial [Phymastichus coffea]
MQLLARLLLPRFHPRRSALRYIYHCSQRLTNTATVAERQARSKLDTETALSGASIDASIVKSQRALLREPDANISLKAPIPLLETFDKTAGQIVDDSSKHLPDELVGHQPFQDVPGPALLKLWEKYWRYVPLFGTQLFRSVLINGLSEGRLLWNRNVSPLRYLFNEYGPIVRLNGPFTGDVVLIHRPEHIAKVFQEEGDSPTRSSIDVLQHYRLNYRKYRFSGPFCTQGTDSLEWIKTKKSLEVPMSEQVLKQFPKLEMACDELVLRIRQTKNRQDEVPSNFHQELLRWGMECFWILMLNRKIGFLDSTGYSENSETNRFIEALVDAHLYMSRCETGFQFWRFMETPFSRKLFTSCDIIDNVIGKYIRIAQGNLRKDISVDNEEDAQIRSTILDHLLIKQRMNPDDVSTLLMDMVILGMQATVNSQAFLLYYLAKNPRVQRKLHAEINLKARNDLLITKATLDNMPYLSACINECLRLRPPFPYLTRLLPKTIVLHGYTLPKGTYIIMANQISSQKEENFEDPEKFKPERWLNTNEESYPKNSYLPFGKGLRSCIGESMAKLEMMLLTTKVLREFRVEYDYADINSRFLMMNVPSRPLRFRFVDRE